MQEDDELLPPLEAAQPWRPQTEAQRARWEARQRRVLGQGTTTEDKVFQFSQLTDIGLHSVHLPRPSRMALCRRSSCSYG